MSHSVPTPCQVVDGEEGAEGRGASHPPALSFPGVPPQASGIGRSPPEGGALEVPSGAPVASVRAAGEGVGTVHGANPGRGRGTQGLPAG